MYYLRKFLSYDILHGGLALLFLLILFIFMAFIVISVIANWVLFKKAGKGGWEAIIPFYNNYVLVEIAGLNWWWILLIFAPNIVSFIDDDLALMGSLVSLIASFNCYYNIAKKFKKDTTTSVLAGIFSFIFLLIFAFSKNEKYYKIVKVSPNGVFGGDSKEITKDTAKENTSTANNDTEHFQLKYCKKCGCKVEDNYKFCSMCGEKIE